MHVPILIWNPEADICFGNQDSSAAISDTPRGGMREPPAS